MTPRGFLLYPCVERGRGSGHVARSIALMRALAERGAEARLCLPEGRSGTRGGEEIASAFGLRREEWFDEASTEREWAVAVTDLYATDRASWELVRRHPVVVGIDEGGPFRERFDFLIDILPRLSGAHSANYADALGLLDLPETRREPSSPPERVILSFGAEDHAGLGIRAARSLRSYFPSARLIWVRGQLDEGRERPPEGVEVVGPMKGLKDAWGDYDLAVTHFGLSAYEAAAAGCAVLLANPSPYHERLAQAAGFPSLGSLPAEPWNLDPWFGGAKRIYASMEAVRDRLRRSAAGPLRGGPAGLAEFLLRMPVYSPEGGSACPACGSVRLREASVAFREAERSYRPCRACGTMILHRAAPPSIEYDASYFDEDYLRQYGRTYLEDMPKLRGFASERIAIIESLSGSLAGKRVLDVGCAYGAFLLEARDRGAVVAGIDPAEAAVERLRSQGIGAARGFFPDVDASSLADGKRFDVLTLWYVAEHIGDLKRALAACHSLLAEGGVLALSTPNLAGVSGRTDLRAFLRASPADHLSVLSPESARKALAAAGFRLERARVTGHHPERFPLPARKGRRTTAFLGALSRFLRLGDTFEAYARREGPR